MHRQRSTARNADCTRVTVPRRINSDAEAGSDPIEAARDDLLARSPAQSPREGALWSQRTKSDAARRRPRFERCSGGATGEPIDTDGRAGERRLRSLAGTRGPRCMSIISAAGDWRAMFLSALSVFAVTPRFSTYAAAAGRARVCVRPEPARCSSLVCGLCWPGSRASCSDLTGNSSTRCSSFARPHDFISDDAERGGRAELFTATAARSCRSRAARKQPRRRARAPPAAASPNTRRVASLAQVPPQDCPQQNTWRTCRAAKKRRGRRPPSQKWWTDDLVLGLGLTRSSSSP